LAFGAMIVAAGILLGRLAARALRRGRGSRANEPLPSEVIRDPLAAFAFNLGDVVLRRVEGDEAWLTGALVFTEVRPVAALFIAPEPGGDRAVLVASTGAPGVTWLSPLTGHEVASGREPLHAIELAGVRFERTRRLPVHVERVGTGAPSVGERAIIAEYRGAGPERVLVVAGSDATLAWRGVAVLEGEYEVLPGERLAKSRNG
jgi:hypothetical protein